MNQDAFGRCDCEGDQCFKFSVRASSSVSNSSQSIQRVICACPKCKLVPQPLRAEVFLFDSELFSSSGGTLFSGVTGHSSQNQSDSSCASTIVCDLCKLCVGFQFQNFGITAVSKRVVDSSKEEQKIPDSTLSKYCTYYFTGLIMSLHDNPHNLTLQVPAGLTRDNLASSGTSHADASVQHHMLHSAGPRTVGRDRLKLMSAAVKTSPSLPASPDPVAFSVNIASSKHRAKLLGRSIRGVKGKVAPDLCTNPAGEGDDENGLRELDEDCQFIHRTSIGRLATMSLSLQPDFLNN